MESVVALQGLKTQEPSDDEHEDDVLSPDNVDEVAGEEEEQITITTSATTNANNIKYNRRKPRWWRQKSGKATKAQRRAQQLLADKYQLQRPPYGEYINWSSVFAANNDVVGENEQQQQEQEEELNVWYEMGFGLGDNLLRLAELYPHTKFIGAEVHPSAVGKAMQRIQCALDENQPWQEYTEYQSQLDPSSVLYVVSQPNSDDCADDGDTHHNKDVTSEEATAAASTNNDAHNDQLPTPDTNNDDNRKRLYSNVRIYGGDGVPLLQDYIPPHSFAAALITFPDPFAKDSEKQWRVIQLHTVQDIHSALRQNGGRLYLATDHPVFHTWAHHIVNEFNKLHNNTKAATVSETTTQSSSSMYFQLIEPCPDRSAWLPVISKYEQKGWDEGRHTLLSCWEARTVYKCQCPY